MVVNSILESIWNGMESAVHKIVFLLVLSMLFAVCSGQNAFVNTNGDYSCLRGIINRFIDWEVSHIVPVVLL